MSKEVGRVYRTKGLDMNCFPVEVKAKLVRMLPKEEVKEITCHDGSIMVQDCVIESEGCKIYSDSSELY